MKKSDELFKELEEVIRYKKYEFIEDNSKEITDILNLDTLINNLVDFFYLKNIDVDNIYKLFDIIVFRKKGLININGNPINFIYMNTYENKISLLVVKGKSKFVINLDFTRLNEVKVSIDNKLIVVDFSSLFQQYLFEKIVNFLNSDMILVNLIDLFSNMNINEIKFKFSGTNKIDGFVFIFNNKIDFFIDKNNKSIKVGNFQMSF